MREEEDVLQQGNQLSRQLGGRKFAFILAPGEKLALLSSLCRRRRRSFGPAEEEEEVEDRER